MSDRLTPRQREVLALRARGLSRDEVMATLGIARNTYYHHLADAYRRLGLPEYCYAAGAHDGCLTEAWRRLGWLAPPDD